MIRKNLKPNCYL